MFTTVVVNFEVLIYLHLVRFMIGVPKRGKGYWKLLEKEVCYDSTHCCVINTTLKS